MPMVNTQKPKTSKTSKSWFDVSREGMRKTFARDEQERLILEIISNALDAPGTTEVIVDLTQHPLGFMVTDNGHGVQRLADLYTVFGESNRAHDADKRGRFCVGEKRVLAGAEEAVIRSTSGSVWFRKTGVRRESLEDARASGTSVSVTYPEYSLQKAFEWATRIIPPEGVTLRINFPHTHPTVLTTPKVLGARVVNLPTEIAQEGEPLRRSRRNTSFTVYEALEGNGWLYELGVPVVELDSPYSVNVGQKIPLTIERDNVSPAFMLEVRANLLNIVHAKLDPEEVRKPWVSEALESPNVVAEAVRGRDGSLRREGGVV